MFGATLRDLRMVEGSGPLSVVLRHAECMWHASDRSGIGESRCRSRWVVMVMVFEVQAVRWLRRHFWQWFWTRREGP